MHQINRKSRVIETYSLIFIDLLSVAISYLLALMIRFGNIRTSMSVQVHYTVCVYIMLFCVLYGVLSDWNRGFFDRGHLVEFIAIVKYNVVLVLAITCLMYFVKLADLYSRLTFGFFAVFNVFIMFACHSLFKVYVIKFYQNSASSDKVMIVTESIHVAELVENIVANKAWFYEITSIAILDNNEIGKKYSGIPVVANKDSLFDISRQMLLDQVFIYLPNTDVKEIREIIRDFETMGVECHYNVEMKELDLEGKTAGKFAGYAVMTFSLQYLDYRRVMIKRCMDILGSLIGMLILVIVFPFVSIAIKIDSPGPILFGQPRVGKNGRRFKMYKFRSMYIDAEERKKELEAQNEMKGLMFKMENDPRITRVGKFIRKTSIDELPQFWNILVGQMSFVGTRPPTVSEFEQYNNYYRRRLSITPGLTGMWQVSGRSDITDFDEVVRLDLEYIDNWSLRLDMKILFQTIWVVLFGNGSK